MQKNKTNKKTNKKIKNIITGSKIRSWNKNEIIIINAPTGSGKSYWCRNVLYSIAKQERKKILMLVNRTRIRNQFNEEVEYKEDNILSIMTYQYLENEILKNNKTILACYDYIVCDEFHYFLSDAEFNQYTDLSLYEILETYATKIFMSATGEECSRYIKQLINQEVVEYNIDNSINKIKKLNFYNKKKDLFDFARECINRNQKSIFFIKSAKLAYEIHKEFKENTIFCCSKYNSKYYKYVDTEEVDKVLVNEKFDKNILITTTCLDCGITIKDKDVQHILLYGILDIEQIKQCIGRKRFIDDNEKLYVYINNFTNEQLGGFKTQLTRKIKKAEYFKDHNLKEYLTEYPRTVDNENIIYDVPIENDINKCSKKVNELMLLKRKSKINMIDEMLEYKYGFTNYIARELNFKMNDCRIISQGKNYDEENEPNNIEEYLENHLDDIMLTANDRKELINILNVTDSRGRLLKNINTLNGALEEMNSNYRIKQFETSKIKNGKKRKYKNAWKIIR